MRYWLHNEFLLLNNAKIAKSSGPVPRLADLVEAGYHPMAYRLFLLGGHYRSQLDFTTTRIDAAQATLRRLVARVDPLRPLPVAETYDAARALRRRHRQGRARVRGGNRRGDRRRPGDAEAARHPAGVAARPDISAEGLRVVVVAAADALLGLRLADLDPCARWTAAAPPPTSTPAEVAAIERMIAERTQARMEKNWARADEIRAELDALGVQVTDTPAGPTWQLRNPGFGGQYPFTMNGP